MHDLHPGQSALTWIPFDPYSAAACRVILLTVPLEAQYAAVSSCQRGVEAEGEKGKGRTSTKYGRYAPNGRRIHDPATISRFIRILLQHLGNSILAAEKDRLGVNSHGLVPLLFAHEMQRRRTPFSNAHAGIVHHPVLLTSSTWKSHSNTGVDGIHV